MSTRAQNERALEAYRKPKPVQHPKARKCMRCRETFLSEGPHNRLCSTCRNKPNE